jgi:hypothetical protein
VKHAHQFRKHYTRDEARALLPQVRQWLGKLVHMDERLQSAAQRVEQLMTEGHDRGGATVEDYLALQAECFCILGEFERRQILVKDLQRGLVDFPAIIGGREVFLCWEMGEDDIEFWHEIDEGYAGRERL